LFRFDYLAPKYQIPVCRHGVELFESGQGCSEGAADMPSKLIKEEHE